MLSFPCFWITSCLPCFYISCVQSWFPHVTLHKECRQDFSGTSLLHLICSELSFSRWDQQCVLSGGLPCCLMSPVGLLLIQLLGFWTGLWKTPGFPVFEVVIQVIRFSWGTMPCCSTIFRVCRKDMSLFPLDREQVFKERCCSLWIYSFQCALSDLCLIGDQPKWWTHLKNKMTWSPVSGASWELELDWAKGRALLGRAAWGGKVERVNQTG